MAFVQVAVPSVTHTVVQVSKTIADLQATVRTLPERVGREGDVLNCSRTLWRVDIPGIGLQEEDGRQVTGVTMDWSTIIPWQFRPSYLSVDDWKPSSDHVPSAEKII